jgi:hypothetical protein
MRKRSQRKRRSTSRQYIEVESGSKQSFYNGDELSGMGRASEGDGGIIDVCSSTTGFSEAPSDTLKKNHHATYKVERFFEKEYR